MIATAVDLSDPPFRLREGVNAYRGMPVPYSVRWLRTVEGPRPDFTALDIRKALVCTRQRRCSVCSYKLPAEGQEIAFIGGRKSTAFTDPPMHLDCARFSIRACPFIVTGRQRPIFADEGSGVPMIDSGESVIFVTTSFRFHKDGILIPGKIIRIEGKPID